MGLKEDIDRITRQEQALVFSEFNENTAFKLGTWLRRIAENSAWGLTIDIRDFSRPLFYAATPGTTPENVDWLRRKFNVVKHFHKSSYRVGLEMRLKETTLEMRSGLSVADYAAHGGGFPLRVADAGVIGCIAVSGLPQRLDHETVVEALCRMLGKEFSDYALGPEG